MGFGDNSTGQNQAFRWTQAGGTVTLPFLPGGTFTEAYSVSGDGSVVVGDSDDGAGQSQAFRWTQAGGTESVASLLGAALPSGWSLKQANVVSADGLIIVGTGTDPNGAARSWLADLRVIPTPAMLPGLIGMGIAAWRKRSQEELAGDQEADPVMEEV